MGPSPSSDPFVGREREMAELNAALENALEGRGGIVMLVGEPGIGKTRMTEELAIVASDRGARATRGACYEGGSAPPYWPWTRAIRSLLIEPSEATLGALESRAAVIAEIIPEIKNMMPDLTPASEVDPEQARFRLFDTVTSFLSELASTEPLVIVLDDLHWADRSSLDLLEFVADEVSSRSMLLVGGYRDMELSRRHPLSESLATLARIRGFQRILLRGLESSAVGRLVEAIGDVALPVELIEEIHVRTEGNPFFISEVTRDMAREAGVRGGNVDAVKFKVPEGVREAVGIRLNRLSEECNQLLRTAAVIGREFDFDLLSAVNAGSSEDELLDAVEEALTMGAIREAPGVGERYEFAHALIQETLAEELPTVRRTRLHARVVGALEKLHGDEEGDHISELAYHSAEAELIVGSDKVARYSRAAGERAAASYAFVEARGYFERALEALAEQESGAEQAAILFGLGKAEMHSLVYPHLQRGWDNIAKAFDLYEELDDSQSALTVVLQVGGFPPDHVRGTARVFSRALEIAPPNSQEAGHLLVLYSGALASEEQDAAGSMKALDQGHEIATNLGDKRLEARALVRLCTTRHWDFDFHGAVEAGLKAIDLARDANAPREEYAPHYFVAMSFVAIGDPDAAWKLTESSLLLGEQYGYPKYAARPQHYIAYLRGDQTKMELAGELLASARIDDSVARLFVAIGAWHAKEPSNLNEVIKASQEEVRPTPIFFIKTHNAVYLALAARLMDRLEDAIRAGEIVRSVLSAPRLTVVNEVQARIAAGLAAVATRDPQQASEHYHRLNSLRGAGVGWHVPICADRLLGLLAHTAGMLEDSAAHFEAALEFTGKAGYQLELAWTCHDYAELLLDRGEPSGVAKAISLIDDGLETSRETGLVAIEKRIIGLQERARTMSAPAAPYPDGLTNREVEVLRVVAAGMSNREIGEELFISENTVIRHVSNIFSKTGSTNRAQAAVYAERNNLQ